MKSISTVLLGSLVFASASAFAATIENFDSPMIEANKALFDSQLGGIQNSFNASGMNKGAIDLTQIYGNYNAGTYSVKVAMLGYDFGASWAPDKMNGFGLGGDDMRMFTYGNVGYTGVESYLNFNAGDPASLMVYSAFLNDRIGQGYYEMFSNSQGLFAWKVEDILTQYYELVNGEYVLVEGLVKTLIVGFEDSAGLYDMDFNDMIFAIQFLTPDQVLAHEGKPSGQPLPGVFVTALVALGFFKLRSMRRKSA